VREKHSGIEAKLFVVIEIEHFQKPEHKFPLLPLRLVDTQLLELLIGTHLLQEVPKHGSVNVFGVLQFLFHKDLIRQVF
jgi:hypothetical protein